jgi:hypothetical protein
VRARSRAFVGALLVLAVASVGAADDASQRLLAAAAPGDAAHVTALAREGADPNARDSSFRPALLLAAATGRPEAVRALLRAGASADAGDRSGWTALHQAVENGDIATARVLLDAGATPDLRSRARGTALDLAERTGRAELARLLRARGARGSGKSIGDTVCVRPWTGEPSPNGRPTSGGEGYCGVVLAVDATRFQLRVSEIVGCDRGCAADEACSAGRPIGAGGIVSGEVLWVPASCLTHTGVER